MRLLLLFSFLPFISFGQTWTWDSSFVEPVAWYSVKVVKDQQKRVYRYKGHELTRVYDAGGSSNWKISLPQNLLISSVVFDNQSCFIAGTFTGVCHMGATSYTANGMDGWIARFALDGTLGWFNSITGPNSQGCGEICLLGNDIAVTGGADDTLKYFGTTIPNKILAYESYLFVSKISKAGHLKFIKISSTDSTVHQNMYTPFAIVKECASDELGNLFIYAQFEGHTTFAGQHFKHPLHETRDVIIKLDNSLNLVYCSTIGGDCDLFCYPHHELHINTKSEVLLLHNYGYNDDATNLLVLGADGKMSTVVPLTKDADGHIYDMDLDSCDNLYLTGYGSHQANTQPQFFFHTTYQLSPEYNVTWKKNDTVYLMGSNILSLSYNECFVFANNADNSGGVFKLLEMPIISRCKNLTSLVEGKMQPNIKIYPNPSDGNFMIQSEKEADLEVMNVTGQSISQIHVKKGVQEIDTKNYPPGIYFFRYKNTCVKFIKL